MICKNCGAEMQEHFKYCPKCGNKTQYTILPFILLIICQPVIQFVRFFAGLSNEGWDFLIHSRISNGGQWGYSFASNFKSILLRFAVALVLVFLLTVLLKINIYAFSYRDVILYLIWCIFREAATIIEYKFMSNFSNDIAVGWSYSQKILGYYTWDIILLVAFMLLRGKSIKTQKKHVISVGIALIVWSGILFAFARSILGSYYHLSDESFIYAVNITFAKLCVLWLCRIIDFIFIMNIADQSIGVGAGSIFCVALLVGEVIGLKAGFYLHTGLFSCRLGLLISYLCGAAVLFIARKKLKRNNLQTPNNS